MGAELQGVGGGEWLLEGHQRKALGSGVAAGARDPAGGGCGVGPMPPGDGAQPQREGPSVQRCCCSLPGGEGARPGDGLSDCSGLPLRCYWEAGGGSCAASCYSCCFCQNP